MNEVMLQPPALLEFNSNFMSLHPLWRGCFPSRLLNSNLARNLSTSRQRYSALFGLHHHQTSTPAILSNYNCNCKVISAASFSMSSTSASPAGRTYEDAISSLNTLQSNHAILSALRASGGKLNSLALPEMREYLSRIGYAVSDLAPLNIIHISGTKGKGSTSAFTSHILTNHLHLLPKGRQKVGLYTSPHLRSVRERIRINNEPISKELFAKYFWEVWDLLGKAAEEKGVDSVGGNARPVYFRYLTLLAFHAYLSEKIGVVVLEVGIGGEYDSTNVVENPIATGVSKLGIDHVHVLGETLPQIAWHKAGIFKPGVAAISASQSTSAIPVLEERAQERNVLDQEIKWAKEEEILLPPDTELGLQGDFQRGNAALAVAVAAESIRVITKGETDIAKSTWLQKKELPELVRKGLKETIWQGRCQVIPDGRLHSSLEWCLDGAHTTDSLEAAGTWFAEREAKIYQNQPKARSRILLFNQQTRDATSLLKTLHWTLTTKFPPPPQSQLQPQPFFTHVIFTTNLTRKTGFSPDLHSSETSKSALDNLVVQRTLEQEWAVLDSDSTVGQATRWVVGSIEEAVERIRGISTSEEGSGGSEEVGREQGMRKKEVVVFCTGSLHLVGGVLEVLDDSGEGN